MRLMNKRCTNLRLYFCYLFYVKNWQVRGVSALLCRPVHVRACWTLDAADGDI